MIRKHLWWKGQEGDNLVSSTGSLLFALKNAMYWDVDHATSFKDIKLRLIDTAALPANVFVKDIDLIRETQSRGRKHASTPEQTAVRIRWSLLLRNRVFDGSLSDDGSCKIISIQDLINVVLFALRPELYDYREQAAACANKVIKIRQVFYGKSHLLVLDAVKVDVAMRIGDFFGPRWKLPMAAAFMSCDHTGPGQWHLSHLGRAFTAQHHRYIDPDCNSGQGRLWQILKQVSSLLPESRS